tara:strand:+ start:4246 stop:5802 length:1557 start_codon:yes stop_codon:yes gene_type:complete
MSFNNTTNAVIRIIANTSDVGLLFIPTAVNQTSDIPNYQNYTSDIRTFLSSKGLGSLTGGSTLTVSNNSTSNTTTINSGTDNEKKEIKISAIVPFNKFVKIGSFIISANSNKKLSNKPSLVLNQSLLGTELENSQILQLRPVGTTVTDGFITTRSFNLFYKTNRAITLKDNLSYSLNISAEKKVVKTLQIKDVVIKDEIKDIISRGENKKIRIYGTPKTNFKFTIFDDNNNCLLAYNKFNTTITSNTGAIIKAFEGKISKTGFYDCDVSFPSAPRILTTAVNVGGGVANATQVTFDSLVGVSVGDQLISSFVKPYKSVKVNSIDSEFVCTLSRPITAADDTAVYFITNANYNFLIESTDSLGSNIPTTNPNFIFKQFVTPVLTVKGSTSTNSFSINGGSVGADNEDYYDGIANANFETVSKKLNYTSTFLISYSLVRDGSKTFSLIKQPVFSLDETISDFTNTNPSLNGGTELDISRPKLTISSDTLSCTITARVRIVKWGTSDLTVELDLDQLVSCT